MGNVQLYKCHGQHNQQFEIVGGMIKSRSLGRCVTAAGSEANKDVTLKDCVADNELQQWDLTADSYVKLNGNGVCLDVKAAEVTEDGKTRREVWSEIKEHTTVNVHLYTCHNV